MYANSQEINEYNLLYPLSIYKLLVFYEELTVFDKLYSEEKQLNLSSSQVIVESFKYSLIIDKPL